MLQTFNCTHSGYVSVWYSGKIAYVPNTKSDANQSVNNLTATNTGAVNSGTLADSGAIYTTGGIVNGGRTFTQYQVTAAPIDGLALGASYGEFGGATGNKSVIEGGSWVTLSIL